jgi:hypothetical protein
MWCSLGTSTPPWAYARELAASWQRSAASKSCSLTRWNSSIERLEVLARGDDLGQVEPVAVDDRAVRRHRVHAVEDHVVGHQVDEDLRVDRDRVVPAVVLGGHAGMASTPSVPSMVKPDTFSPNSAPWPTKYCAA